MDAKQVLQACEVLNALAANADGAGENREGRARVAQALLLAEAYLLEYVAHLQHGHDSFDALARTARSAEADDL